MRLEQQTGVLTKKFSMNVPRAAISSEIRGSATMSSFRMSSAKMKTKFGRRLLPLPPPFARRSGQRRGGSGQQHQARQHVSQRTRRRDGIDGM